MNPTPSPPPALPARTRIKICGLTREQDVDAAVAAGADAIGLVLWNGSARAVSVERAAALAARLPPFVTPMLLFVNEAPATVRAALARVPGAIAQFHGDETPAQCLESVGEPLHESARADAPGFGMGCEAQSAAIPRGVASICNEADRPNPGCASRDGFVQRLPSHGTHRFLRAARIPSGAKGAGFDLLKFIADFSAAQAILLDAHVEGYGGSGKGFDWSLLPPAVNTHLVLSGGLNAANVGAGIRLLRSRCLSLAVDVSSGVESAKGVKDAGKMREFTAAVRAADLSA